ncbi:DUF1987 domain-containing protein [Rhabdochromatium marinum]|uniref:DUF1987 domain-containing protein n=1 Tax=Rhabdochromatium marinum TaxID=48729 RepID=UPI001907E323|nr:DUF1987 domain-containing protein [Rhabdochromatium marinum]MBK1650050.1 Fe-S oxidoreductase [Rhabdochromatium marinum]
MQSIHREATKRSPELRFDFAHHRLSLAGESYPEDAAAFFGPPLQAMADYLDSLTEASVELELRMTYFNSSSAKALMNMFQLLERAAARGITARVRWYYDPEDDAMQEFGEDFAADFQHSAFEMIPLPTD